MSGLSTFYRSPENNRQRLLQCLQQTDGSSILEIALLMPVLLLLLVIAVDLGRAYYVAIEVTSAAQAGALYGTQNPTDTDGMVAASKLDAPDVSDMSSTVTYGIECFDGNSSVASCPYNVVSYVQVVTSVSHAPLLHYPGIPDSFLIRSKARMRAAH